ncbi:hypothetical protein Hamer_G023234 [Homarus americanus]|uniref:Uncharacterized protein n=1 Tax=Homarus americanus TaxID=6706 RepID=A0A8J5KAI4_HOMAM|nr:hypothetical protein Hamer_G023234 [Homarus americanus]
MLWVRVASGGRVSVFWLSRTDFEKKLLVTVVVLSAAVLSLIIALAIVASKDSGNVQLQSLASHLDNKVVNFPDRLHGLTTTTDSYAYTPTSSTPDD